MIEMLILIVIIIAWIFVMMAVAKEAERKLKRELTVVELVLGTVTMPYSMLYVLFFMEEK